MNHWPSCSGSFAWLGSHPSHSLAARKDATFEVALPTCRLLRIQICMCIYNVFIYYKKCYIYIHIHYTVCVYIYICSIHLTVRLTREIALNRGHLC